MNDPSLALNKLPVSISSTGITLEDDGEMVVLAGPNNQIGNEISGTLVRFDPDEASTYFFTKDFELISSNFKVEPNGFVYARQIEVQATGSFPDYVFEDEYELMNLPEVKAFISENGHLPGVPSAEEVEEQGHNLAKMDEILLEKIEQLTLYVIQLHEENEDLKSRIEHLEE